MSSGRFYLYTSSRMETLADLYADTRRRQPLLFRPADILSTETIVVPTKGVAVWLEHYLCQRHSFVLANISFPFIRSQIDDLLRRRQPAGATEENPFAPYSIPRMTWDIMSLLHCHLDQYQELHEYLDEAVNRESCPQLRHYQLAVRIAQLFDQYLIYRPALLQDWCDKPAEHEHWQALLWRQLRQQAACPSPAEALLEFCQGELQPEAYAPLSIFGSSVMPASFLRVFKKLSTVVPVHFFYLNPCEEYWADQKNKWQRREHAAFEDTRFSNPLLGNLGMQGQEFFREVLQLEDIFEIEPESEADGYRNYAWIDDRAEAEPEIAGPGILQRLQHDIRKQVSPGDDDELLGLSDGDDSLTIHSCHYDLRQVEVLHNHLLALLQKHHYALNDILIMAPDINRFATLIQAVFDQGPLAGHYALSDRSISQDNLLAEAFLGILSLCHSRFPVSQVLQLLDSQALRARFGFSSEDMVTIRAWLSEAKVHWGKDAAERELLYGRAFANYSWRQGLDRLLLGLAIDDEQDSPPLLGEQLLPLSQANGQENRQLLEKLGQFINALFALAKSIPREGLTVQEWSGKLTGILETFFLANADSAFDYGVMANTIQMFIQNLQPSNYAGKRITLPVVSSILSEALQIPQETAGFLSGKITCCSLLPMRSIPCKVIALLGMDEDAFPRQENPLGFSIIAQEGRPLDRRRQWEDRFLFLETLLSAQEYLLLYYHGQDEFDQKEHSPSTVIAEVLEYIQLCTGESLSDICSKIIIRHPLHAFSPKSFPDSSVHLFSPAGASGLLRQVFSYDRGSWKVARGLILRSQPAAATTEEDNPFPAERWPVFPASSWQDDTLRLSLLELENCLIDASEFYAVHSLRLPGREWSKPELSDWEEYQLSRPDQQALLRELSEKEVLPQPETDEYQLHYKRLLADNRLPVGEYGRLTYDELIHTGSFRDGKFKQEWQQRQQFSGTLVLDGVGTVWPENVSDNEYFKVLQSAQPEALLTCEISGKFLAREHADGVLHCSFKKETRGRQLLRFYVRHLYLAALQDQPCCSYLRNDNDQMGFCLSGLSQEQARTYLRRLLRVYTLASQRPLPLFEYASLTAVTAGAPQKIAEFPAKVHSKSGQDYASYDAQYNQYVRAFWGEKFPMALAGPLAWYCYEPLMAKTIFGKLQKSDKADDYCQRFFLPCDLLTFTPEGE